MIFLVLLGALTAFVAVPLYARARPAEPGPDTAFLLARRQTLVASLRELELDRATGGVDEESYAAERAHLEDEAARVLRELDD